MMAMVDAWRTIPTHEACRHSAGWAAQCIEGKPGILVVTGCAYANAHDTDLHRSKFAKRRIIFSVVTEIQNICIQ